MDRTNLEMVQQVSVGSAPINRVVWHPKINQIVAASVDAKVYVLYDPQLSTKGALLAAGRAPRKKEMADFIEITNIVTPGLGRKFKEKTKGQVWREERAKSKPEPPNQSGPGKRAGAAQYTMSQFLTQSLIRDTVRDADPREALLKYADESTKNPVFFRSYQDTQPVATYDTEYGDVFIGLWMCVQGGEGVLVFVLFCFGVFLSLSLFRYQSLSLSSFFASPSLLCFNFFPPAS
jgi:hypothetical protein